MHDCVYHENVVQRHLSILNYLIHELLKHAIYDIQMYLYSEINFKSYYLYCKTLHAVKGSINYNKDKQNIFDKNDVLFVLRIFMYNISFFYKIMILE